MSRCPNCKAASAAREANPTFPFCSERCRLIDLGAWLTEQHSIPGEPAPVQDNPVPQERGLKDPGST